MRPQLVPTHRKPGMTAKAVTLILSNARYWTWLSTSERYYLRPCHTRQFPMQLATQWRCIALQVARKTSSCDTPCLQLVSQRKIALQVAEKVEAASTFRHATRQVAACDTPPATCQLFNVVFLVVIAFMIVKLSFRLFIVRLIHDLVLNLLNSLNFCGFSKFPFVVPL